MPFVSCTTSGVLGSGSGLESSVLSLATAVWGLDGRHGLHRGMKMSVANGTGGCTAIKVGTGGVADVKAGGALETEVEDINGSALFSSSDITMLSWNSATISGRPIIGSADCPLSVLDFGVGASASESDGSTSGCLGRRTGLALVLLSSSVVSDDSSKSACSCEMLRSPLSSDSLARFCASSRLKSAVVMADVSGIGASVGAAAALDARLGRRRCCRCGFSFPRYYRGTFDFGLAGRRPKCWPVRFRLWELLSIFKILNCLFSNVNHMF